MTTGKLILKDGTEISGVSFGREKSAAGEVVFNTGMVGYPESLTDPSYTGQILVMTYPLIGNYGVPDKKYWESSQIQVTGLIVSSYIDTPSHCQSQKSLKQWLRQEGIPALEIKDTRGLTQKLRRQGVMLGKIEFDPPISSLAKEKNELKYKIVFQDPNRENLVARLSTKKIYSQGNGQKTVVLLDCGVKKNIIRELVKRHVKVLAAPWDFDLQKTNFKFDGVIISNGPGDPKKVDKTITTVKQLIQKRVPILGICLGHQILALAAGGDTYKLKFGHRSQNQPVVLNGADKCFLTTQNHGFAVGKIPPGFRQWFYNINDKTNEGIIHNKFPFMSVQFHPESHPGPLDTEWLFDEFIKKL